MAFNRTITLEEIASLRSLFKKDTRIFIKKIASYISSVKKKEDMEVFYSLAENLGEEIKDISPFISSELNRIFCMMVKFHFYKEVANFISIISSCINIKTVEVISKMISEPGLEKYITSLDVYKIKRLIFDVYQKREKFKNIVLEFNFEVADPFLSWVDII